MYGSIKQFFQHMLSGEHDYHGQRCSMAIIYIGSLIALLCGLIIGAATNNYNLMMKVVTAIYIVIAIMIIPSWPYFRRNLAAKRAAIAKEFIETEGIEAQMR